MRLFVVTLLGLALVLFAGCCGNTAPDPGEGIAIHAAMDYKCGFGNTTVEQAVNRDGVHQVGSRYGPLRYGAFKSLWKSDYDPSLTAEGYTVYVYFTGNRGKVEYKFHWDNSTSDGEVVRYMNPEARRALEACD